MAGLVIKIVKILLVIPRLTKIKLQVFSYTYIFIVEL